MRPIIVCDHEWQDAAAEGEELFPVHAAPPELELLGELACRLCGLPAIKVRAADGRQWIGVYGSRFAATTGIHQPQQWIAATEPATAGSR